MARMARQFCSLISNAPDRQNDWFLQYHRLLRFFPELVQELAPFQRVMFGAMA